ncbi:MAG: RagB/SusD family nutrient uptake outer membrane protein [Bacteroidetes bacterium]|nr:RagB/SusD family nutrient uptake outer membrane protein [Bacteroidota bacterium]
MVPYKGNSELIFEVQFKAPEITNSFDIALAQYSTVAPFQNLIDAYQMIDGESIDDSPLYDPANRYLNRDPRFYMTIVYIGAPFRGKIADDRVCHTTGYTYKKLTMYDTLDIGTITASEMNFPFIRYADILLMYAEAMNEVNGPTMEVYDAINQIRNRPTVEMPDLPVGLNKDQMREAIRFERRIEFAGEGLYFYDMRRWKTAEVVNVGTFYDYQGGVKSIRVFNPARDYLWPIPFPELDLNPNLIQNPGY